MAAKLRERQIRSCASTGQGELEKKGRLTIQCDEMWSFVGKKDNKQWIWLALDVSTREIVGVYVGERSREGAQGLWASLPGVYRQCAVCHTDFWSAYEEVLPSQRHQAVGKDSGKTSYIETFGELSRAAVQLHFASTSVSLS